MSNIISDNNVLELFPARIRRAHVPAKAIDGSGAPENIKGGYALYDNGKEVAFVPTAETARGRTIRMHEAAHAIFTHGSGRKITSNDFAAQAVEDAYLHLVGLKDVDGTVRRDELSVGLRDFRNARRVNRKLNEMGLRESKEHRGSLYTSVLRSAAILRKGCTERDKRFAAKVAKECEFEPRIIKRILDYVEQGDFARATSLTAKAMNLAAMKEPPPPPKGQQGGQSGKGGKGQQNKNQKSQSGKGGSQQSGQGQGSGRGQQGQQGDKSQGGGSGKGENEQEQDDSKWPGQNSGGDSSEEDESGESSAEPKDGNGTEEEQDSQQGEDSDSSEKDGDGSESGDSGDDESTESGDGDGAGDESTGNNDGDSSSDEDSDEHGVGASGGSQKYDGRKGGRENGATQDELDQYLDKIEEIDSSKLDKKVLAKAQREIKKPTKAEVEAEEKVKNDKAVKDAEDIRVEVVSTKELAAALAQALGKKEKLDTSTVPKLYVHVLNPNVPRKVKGRGNSIKTPSTFGMKLRAGRLALAAANPTGNARLFEKKKTGGTVLIDASGSMSLTDKMLYEIAQDVPMGTIAYYSGESLDWRRYKHNNLYTDGVLSFKGKQKKYSSLSEEEWFEYYKSNGYDLASARSYAADNYKTYSKLADPDNADELADNEQARNQARANGQNPDDNGFAGHLVIYSSKGKIRREQEGTKLPYRFGDNLVDFNAMVWLSKQPAPRYYVTDTGFTGYMETQSHAFFKKLKERKQIIHVTTLEALKEATKKRGKVKQGYAGEKYGY